MKNNYSRENYIDSLRGIVICSNILLIYHYSGEYDIELKIGHLI